MAAAGRHRCSRAVSIAERVPQTGDHNMPVAESPTMACIATVGMWSPVTPAGRPKSDADVALSLISPCHLPVSPSFLRHPSGLLMLYAQDPVLGTIHSGIATPLGSPRRPRGGDERNSGDTHLIPAAEGPPPGCKD